MDVYNRTSTKMLITVTNNGISENDSVGIQVTKKSESYSLGE
jgi:hypothetical protein